jgi:hypothetical protein
VPGLAWRLVWWGLRVSGFGRVREGVKWRFRDSCPMHGLGWSAYPRLDGHRFCNQALMLDTSHFFDMRWMPSISLGFGRQCSTAGKIGKKEVA